MKKKFQYTSEVQSIATIRKDLESLSDTWNIPPSESRQITLMVEELFSTIIRYAFPDKQGYLIELTISLEEGIIHLLLCDNGEAFNPLEYNPDKIADPASSDDHSMELSLIRAFADTLEYKREKPHNLLFIQKTIRSQP